MSDAFDADDISTINGLVMAKLDGLHIELKHVSKQLDSMVEKHGDLEKRIRTLEMAAAQMPLKIALLAAGSGLAAGGGAGALLKALLGGG